MPQAHTFDHLHQMIYFNELNAIQVVRWEVVFFSCGMTLITMLCAFAHIAGSFWIMRDAILRWSNISTNINTTTLNHACWKEQSNTNRKLAKMHVCYALSLECQLKLDCVEIVTPWHQNAYDLFLESEFFSRFYFRRFVSLQLSFFLE